MPLTRIRKRDGRIVQFEAERITNAIYKALLASRIDDRKLAAEVSGQVVSEAESRYPTAIPSVEDIQDIVVEKLTSSGHPEVADDYSAYRRKKAEIRRMQAELKIEEEPKLTVNSLEVLKKRYLLKDDQGNVVETPQQLFRRVAHAIASADNRYGEDSASSEEEFYAAMSRLEFMPNSPTLFNAGTGTHFALSACYVLPVGDSLNEIFTSVKNTALIEQTGGGVGFDFSRLRPHGDIVRSTKGVASGPVSFMRIFDVTTEIIKAGGRRRGAMMAILRVDHPDVLDFIRVKAEEKTLTNFNISVAVTDAFMDALKRDVGYDLVNPRTGKAVQTLDARSVWEKLVESAWRSGDPGVIFIDEINRMNPTPKVGRMESTNPCGEQPLLPYESCNLGSINLLKIVKDDNKIDWDKLRRLIRTGIHFLDNVIDVNPWPIPEVGKITEANRKIGLGVMGFAELLIRLGIPYDSDEAVALGEKVMEFINTEAGSYDEELGLRRGSFPNFRGSIWEGKFKARRNATVTTVAPTGTISIIAGCSSGIEPLFAIAYMRKVLEGSRLLELNPLFERAAKEGGFYSAPLLNEIARKGTLGGFEGVPESARRLFVTAHDIAPTWHVRMQAAFQKHTENAVSKTVNLSEDAPAAMVDEVYTLAHDLGCKGVTVYRYGSKGEQVLNLGLGEKEFTTADEEYAGGTPTLVCETCG